MTQDEQQQVAAASNYLERLIANLARDGANMAMLAESLAIKNKALSEELESLKPKPEPKLEVVP